MLRKFCKRSIVSCEPGLCDIAGLFMVADEEGVPDAPDVVEGHICPPWPSIELWCGLGGLSIVESVDGGGVCEDGDEGR